MAKVQSSNDKPTKKIRPAINPEAKQNQMISLAMDAAEKQLLEGTASSQIIVHFLKLATERERLEREKLEAENQLALAKVEALKSQKHTEELYQNALKAMREYAGQGDDDD